MDDLNIKFGSDLGGITSGVAQVRGLLEQVVSPITNLKGELLELGEVFAAAFAVEEVAQFVEQIAAMGEQVEHLTHQLGMAAEEVTGLQSVMRQMGGSTDEGTGGLTRLDRSIGEAIAKSGTARDTFRGLGISLQDLKTMTPEQVLMKMADRFHDTQDGAVKTDYALRLMGRGSGEWIAALDQGSTGLQAMIDKGKSLHTVFGEQTTEDLAGTAEKINTLKEASLGLAVEGFEKIKTTVDLILDSLVDLMGKFDGTTGKAVVLTGVMKLLGIVCLTIARAIAGVVAVVAELWDVTEGLIAIVLEGIITTAKVAMDVLSGNFTQAASDAKEGYAKIETLFKYTLDRMKTEGNDFLTWSAKLWGMGPPDAKPAGDGKPKPKLAAPPDGSGEDKAAKIAEKIEADHIKTMEQLRQLDLANEEMTLQQRVQMGQMTDVQRIDRLLGYYATKHAADDKDLDEEAARNSKDAAAHAQTINKKLILDQQYANDVRRLQIERQRASEELSAIDADNLRTTQQLEELGLANYEAKLDQEVKLGKLSEERKIALLLDYYSRKHAADLADLDAELVREKGDEAATEATLNKKLLLNQRYNNQVQALNNQMANAQIAAANRALSPFFSGIQQMMTGSMKFRDFWISILNDMGTKFLGLIEKFIEQWLAGELARTAGTIAGETARTTAKETGAAAGLAISAETGLKEIINDAYKAAAGAYQAVVSIPYVGPILAPIAAATAFAAVAAFGVLSSAEGGWDQVPHDQLALIHKNEMVLPASLAGAVRSMANGNGDAAGTQGGPSQGSQSTGGGDVHNWYLSAVDGKSLMRLFRSNPNAFAAGATSAAQRLKLSKGYQT